MIKEREKRKKNINIHTFKFWMKNAQVLPTL